MKFTLAAPQRIVPHTMLALFILSLVFSNSVLATPAVPQIGSTQAFQFTYDGISASDFREIFKPEEIAAKTGQIPKDARIIETKIRGILKHTVLRKTEDTWLVAVSLEKPVIELKVNDDPATEYVQEILEGLKKPAYMHVGQFGAIHGVVFKPSTKSSIQSFYRTAIGLFQWVPSPEGKAEWQSLEQDANGRYMAQYTLQPKPKGQANKNVSITKKEKLEYLPEPFKWMPGQEPADKIVATESTLLFTFDGPKMRSADGTEKMAISVAGKALAYSESSFKLSSAKYGQITPKKLKALNRIATRQMKGGELTLLWQSDMTEREKVSVHEQQLKGRTMDQLLLEMAQADKDDRSRRTKRTNLYLSVQAALFLMPKSANKLLPLLLKANTESMPFQITTGAIGTIGGLPAQEALVVTLKRRRKEPEVAIHLLSTLSDIPDATPETIAVIMDFARTAKHTVVKHAGELALGSTILMLRQKHPQRIKHILTWLLDELKAAKTASRKIDLLRALGNAGMPESQEVLKPFLVDQDPDIRSVAVSALRWDPTDFAEIVLLGDLEQDPSPKVRAAVLEAYGIRPMTIKAIKTHAAVALNDTVPDIRIGAVQNLMRCRFRHPEVIDVLKQALKAEKDEDAKKKLTELMEEVESRDE